MHHKFKGKFFVKGLLFGIIFLGIFSLVVFLLWNWLMPSIFGLTTINYFQAIGILILSKIIFSGFGKKCRHHSHFGPKEYWKKRFEENAAKSGEENTDERTI